MNQQVAYHTLSEWEGDDMAVYHTSLGSDHTLDNCVRVLMGEACLW